jgi:hypothetical protein
MQPVPATKPRPVRSAVAAGIRAAARLCWDCTFPSPDDNQLPDEFRPRASLDSQWLDHARHLSELARNWPRWPQ